LPLNGKLLDVIGSGSVGKKDGDYRSATFNHPQGCALAGEILYVADTENHLLRKVDLAKKTVVTIAGTGEQGVPANAFPGWNGLPLRSPRGRWFGRPAGTKLASPWALAIHERSLFVAMAGYHQIKMPLDAKEIGRSRNGREDIVTAKALTNSAEAAHPSRSSGLTVNENSLFVADSEGSSIRAVALKGNGGVPSSDQAIFPRTVYSRLEIGTDPSDRPPAALPGSRLVNDTLYVADTYNHKIKGYPSRDGEVRRWPETASRRSTMSQLSSTSRPV
jgi:hypothetical protein